MNSSPKTHDGRALPLFCLFLSGAASLVYELVWIKQLSLIFGGTLYAISAVLCAFMGGLALGAWAVQRVLHRVEATGRGWDLVWVYGLLEGAIGMYGLAFPHGLALLEKLYPAAMHAELAAGPLLHGLEFILSALLMLPATLLMGATLPLIGSWSIGGRAGSVFADVSLLYSLNTLGAVFGCLYTQWFAVENFGIRGTTLTAVAMNGLVLLLCFVHRKRTLPRPEAACRGHARPADLDTPGGEEPAPSRFESLLLLFIFVYSGMAALASEILWTRVLVFPLGSSLYSFALILATFLFSIALGSLIAEKALGNSRWALKFLAVELAIGAAAIAILPLFNQVPEWTLRADQSFYAVENTPSRTLLVRSLFAFGLMFPPALGFGLAFPLAHRVHLSLFGTVSRTLGNSYALNTLGAVAGTFLTPFLFIPWLGIRLSLFVIFAGLILLAAFGLVVHLRARPGTAAAALAACALGIAGGFLYADPVVSTQRLGENNLARTEITDDKTRARLLAYKEGDFSTLSVVEDLGTGARTLYVDGFSTATVSRSFGGSAYMEAMGFVPMALHPAPQKALVICFGTGNTLGTVSLFPGVEVDGVEIDKNVLSFAHWFSAWNHGAPDRTNISLRVQDGRTYTRWTRERYDVITLEPMSPVQVGVVNLYSREFYEEARARLNPGGLMMQWLPLHLVGEEDARAIIKTFQAVYPHTSVWNSFLTRIVLLVGAQEPVAIDKRRFDALMQNPDLRASAGRMGINALVDFADFFITGGGPLQTYLADTPVITDDKPLLEHSAVNLLPPLKWQTDESFINLLRFRIGQAPPVTGLSAAESATLYREFEVRTAQRFAVFSRRYHGPGEAMFARRNYPAALEAVKIFLDQNGNAPIRLTGARWALPGG